MALAAKAREACLLMWVRYFRYRESRVKNRESKYYPTNYLILDSRFLIHFYFLSPLICV